VSGPRPVMLRTAARLAGGAAALCVLGGWALAGPPGALGAVLGSLVAAAFFGAGAALMAGTARLDPTLTTIVALGGYVTQVLFLVVVLAVLRDAEWMAVPAFAVSVLAVTAAWLAGLLRGHASAVRSSRLHL
jgi:ATP synthase protein I